MITCCLCGHKFFSVQDFEKHVDTDCPNTEQSSLEYIGTQIIYPDGKSEIKKLYLKPADEFLQRKRTDGDLTEPLNFMLTTSELCLHLDVWA